MEADVIDTSFDGIDPEVMVVQAESACDFLKAIATPMRLMLLCNLVDGEQTVTDLSNKVGAKQSLTSHHLNRLKLSGLVSARRDEKFIYYSLFKFPVMRALH